MSQSRTAYVILGILSIESHKSGYEIRQVIESSVGSFWGESYGQIYPTLKRLAAEALIVPESTSSLQSPGPGRQRQAYSLTDAGRVCLQQWLALPFHNDPPRNEFLLKLFFGREAAPGVTLAHIRELQNRNQQTLAMLLEIEKAANSNPAPSPNQPYWMLTLGLGLTLTRAALDWGEAALAQLSATASAGENPDFVQRPEAATSSTAA